MSAVRADSISPLFQSAPPAKGAIWFRHQLHPDPDCFNPRPPRRGRLPSNSLTRCLASFQSAPPAKGAISGHPNLDSDCSFQSAPPAKGAMRAFPAVAVVGLFQSAPPAKGAIGKSHPNLYTTHVSIRAPREGGDFHDFYKFMVFKFQSAPPAKGAISSAQWNSPVTLSFQSAPPAKGAIDGFGIG